MANGRLTIRWHVCVVLTVAVVILGARPAAAQRDDGLANGAIVGAAIGAGVGVAFTHAVRDSDLVFSQYARGALVFGAIGAGAGLGIDAMLTRTSRVRAGAPPGRVFIAPAVWRSLAGVVVKWKW